MQNGCNLHENRKEYRGILLVKIKRKPPICNDTVFESMARKMIIEVSKKNYHPGTTVYFISNNTHVIKATVMSISGGLYTLSFRGITNEGTAAIRLKASRLYATAEEAKAHLPAHVRERKIAEEKRKESERGFAASGWH